MKIFLDTNVLVSAMATRGLCSDVLREVLASHQLVVSILLLTELKQILREKLRIPGGLIEEIMEMLKQDAHCATPGKLTDIPIQDKNDLVILSSALSGKSELFVTGDKEILNLGKVENTEIVSPRMFWEKLKAQASQKR